MALQFAVIWYGGRWTLIAPGVRYNRYGSRESALAAAQRLAAQARDQGYEVDILLQDVGGELTSAPLEPIEPTTPRDEPPQDAPNSPA